MSRYKFNEDEVPYTILEEFGLNQEMIEDLPVDVYRDILNGRLSPVLPIRVTDRDGNTVSARARFKLVRDEIVAKLLPSKQVKDREKGQNPY